MNARLITLAQILDEAVMLSGIDKILGEANILLREARNLLPEEDPLYKRITSWLESQKVPEPSPELPD